MRRLQTVAVALWTSMIPICFSFTLLLLYVHIYVFTVEIKPSLKFGGGDGGGIQLLPAPVALLVRLHDMDPH